MSDLKGTYTIPINLNKGIYIGKIINASGSWSEKVVVE
jgi:hypothetical protein